MRSSPGALKVVLVLGAILALFAMAAAYSGNDTWPVSLQRPPGQTVPTPAAGQTVVTVGPTAPFSADLGGGFSILGGVGSVDSPINLVFTPQPTGTLPPGKPGFKFLGHAFTLEAFSGLTLLHGFVFHTPVTLCFNYTDADVAAAGGNTANFVFQYFDVGKSAWVDLPTTVDTTARRVCVTISHLSIISLNARVPTGLPGTGDSGFPITTVGAIGLGIAIVLIAVGWALRGRKSNPAPHA